MERGRRKGWRDWKGWTEKEMEEDKSNFKELPQILMYNTISIVSMNGLCQYLSFLISY